MCEVLPSKHNQFRTRTGDDESSDETVESALNYEFFGFPESNYVLSDSDVAPGDFTDAAGNLGRKDHGDDHRNVQDIEIVSSSLVPIARRRSSKMAQKTRVHISPFASFVHGFAGTIAMLIANLCE